MKKNPEIQKMYALLDEMENRYDADIFDQASVICGYGALMSYVIAYSVGHVAFVFLAMVLMLACGVLHLIQRDMKRR